MIQQATHQIDVPAALRRPPQRDGKYQNLAAYQAAAGSVANDYVQSRDGANKVKTRPEQPIPVKSLSEQTLQDAGDGIAVRLCHSTVLMKLNQRWVLTDPVFCKRASPMQWVGPKRWHQMPLTVAQLPPIDVVVLSHNHYDHYDKHAMRELAAKTQYFLVPLDLGAQLIKDGVAAEKIIEHDWWQYTELFGIRFTAAPMQHFSGRSLSDGNTTLWCSWAIHAPQQRVFFSGDGGYAETFKVIGALLGPFDLSLMENGAYNRSWPNVHMFPAESVQAHCDIQANVMLPIHNSSFRLAFHAWDEPMEQVLHYAEQYGVQVTTPVMGQIIRIASPPSCEPWWR